jgi:hypothetical protein
MGYVEGRNLLIEYRGADNQEDRLAADLVQRRVDAIAAYAGPPIVAAKGATTSIPIIFFTGFDPVASGFVPSLNRPGGNVTDISRSICGTGGSRWRRRFVDWDRHVPRRFRAVRLLLSDIEK